MAAFELDPTPKEEWAKQVLYNHQPFDNSIHSGNKVIDPRVYFAIRNPSEQEMRSMLNGLSFETQYLGETQSTTRTQFKSNRRPSEAFGTPAVALSDILAARQTLSRSGLTPVDPSKPDVAQQQQNRVVEAYLAEADRLSVESKVSKPSEVSKLSETVEAAETVEANPNDQTIAPQFEVRLGEGASSVSATQIDLGDIQANVPSLRPGAATAPVVELQPSRDSSLFLQPSLYEVPGLPSLSTTPSPKVSSPVKAVQAVSSVQPVQPVQPMPSASSTQPVSSMPSASSTQPVSSMPSMQFMQPVPSTQPAQPVNLVSSMPSDHYGNPLTPASPLDSVKPLLPTSPAPPRLTPEAAPTPSLPPAPAEEAPILAGSIDLLQAPLAQPRAALDAQSTGAVAAGSDADLMAALLFGDAADRRLLQEPSERSAFSAAPSAAGNLKDNLKDNLTANLTSNATGNATKNTTVSQASNRRAEAVPAVPSPLYSSGSPASRPSTSSLAQSAGFSIGGVGLSGATDA